MDVTIGGGLAPSLLQISTLQNFLLKAQHSPLSESYSNILTNASTNTFSFDAPTALATSTCTNLNPRSLLRQSQTSPLQARQLNITTPGFVYYDIWDSTCGDLRYNGLQIRQGVSNSTGTVPFVVGSISCMVDSSAYTSYYYISPSDSNFQPITACRTGVHLSTGRNIQFSSLNGS